jgi:hypothetical protein
MTNKRHTHKNNKVIVALPLAFLGPQVIASTGTLGAFGALVGVLVGALVGAFVVGVSVGALVGV